VLGEDGGEGAGEEEWPPEVDEEVDEGAGEEEWPPDDETPDSFTLVDVTGVQWDVKYKRRRSEKMSTISARHCLDDGGMTNWKQYLQFNDRTWKDVADEKVRAELSDKAIKDTPW
jgi:hypothetical protein